jgi:hypothetical protein
MIGLGRGRRRPVVVPAATAAAAGGGVARRNGAGVADGPAGGQQDGGQGEQQRIDKCDTHGPQFSGRGRERPLVDDATRIEAARLIARRLLHDYMRLRTQLAARPGDREWRHDVDNETGAIYSRQLP